MNEVLLAEAIVTFMLLMIEMTVRICFPRPANAILGLHAVQTINWAEVGLGPRSLSKIRR